MPSQGLKASITAMGDTKDFVAMKYRYNKFGATSVDWYIGKRCNFDCSYCVDYLHDNISPHVPLENMKKFVDYVYERNQDNVFWSLTGGEPTLNPDFLELCKYIKSRGARNVSITTNGSRSLKYFLELYEYLDNITLSLHFEFMGHQADKYIDKIIKMEEWRKKWNEDKSKQFQSDREHHPFLSKTFLVRFMVYPGALEEIERMNTRLKEAGVEKIEFRYIRPLKGSSNEQMPSKKLSLKDNHDTKPLSLLHRIGSKIQSRVTQQYLKTKYFKNQDCTPQKVLTGKDRGLINEIVKREDQWYNDREKEKINELFTGEDKKRLLLYFDQDGQVEEQAYHYNKLNFERKSNFEGWMCWAGSKHMKITPGGDIYVGSCHVGGRRGNIYNIQKGVDLPEGPIKCPKWRCTDNLDLRVPKVKDMKYYHLIASSVEGEPPKTPKQELRT